MIISLVLKKQLRGFDFYFLSKKCMLIKSRYGIVKILLNECFFFNKTKIDFCFLFSNKVVFSNLFKYLVKLFFSISNLFFFKLRLKGLGYRIFKVTSFLFRFFFAKNHFYYFFLPYSILVRLKKRNFFVVSYKKILLNDLFNHLMLLKKIDFYEKTNSFVLQSKILFLKKRK